MTREILFRGKRQEDGKWIEGGWYYDEISCRPFILQNRERPGSYAFGYTVNSFTIGQYTGLKDKNGRKIFEGDILMDHTDPEHPEAETHAVIEWRGFGWVLVEKGEFFDTVVEADDRTWTVIGNIWDNPELVKEEEHE